MTPWRRFIRRLAGSVIAEAEVETRLARDRLRDALEAIPEGVVFLDAEGDMSFGTRPTRKSTIGPPTCSRPAPG